ncbi:hypothetical protein PC129_g1124 [Phytophthora cactorum]|uniref:Uncharacterized protein n=2 Tax=Phytophthora cactorum TaxID=29920 RepID=A0A329SVV4_9STRA|nr:hypothetical protein PC112_g2143 [Phytophthora cactorum]KAG2867020.1 hypothetical protein PC113_g2315 [Phytophthora cactorum]KAG2930511.1 hypothetical protein PC114_g2450 [Phytophthora cactorum]KAG2943418.1 hypothetical protein PC115_g819 [Phytophthora cactorum]KAG2954467.1 hypothetical protein PC117_g1185 [Phytophthora cactorum]
MLNNQHPGGRYDDMDLAEHPKTLRNTPDIKLLNLTKKESYQTWFSEVPLHVERRLLGEITYGTERFDSVEGYKRPKYAEWYKRITEHFEVGDGVKPDYLRRELMIPLLKPKEAVTKYVQGIGVMVRRLRLVKGEFEVRKHTSLLISNTLFVSPDLAREQSL